MHELIGFFNILLKVQVKGLESENVKLKRIITEQMCRGFKEIGTKSNPAARFEAFGIPTGKGIIVPVSVPDCRGYTTKNGEIWTVNPIG